MQLLAIILASLAVCPALSATDMGSTVAKFQDLNNGIDNVKRAIEGYQGGMLSALPVANSMYAAHKSAEEVRKTLEDSEPLNDSEGLRMLDAYKSMHPRLVETLRAGSAKAPLFKKAGVGYIGRSLLSNLYMEKTNFEGHARDVLSPEHYKVFDPQNQNLDAEFKRAIDAFAT